MGVEYKKIESLVDKALQEAKNTIIFKDQDNPVQAYIKYNAPGKKCIFNINYKDGKFWAFFPLETALALEQKIKNSDFCAVTDPSIYHSGNATALYCGEDYLVIDQIVKAMIDYVLSDEFKEHKARRKN